MSGQRYHVPIFFLFLRCTDPLFCVSVLLTMAHCVCYLMKKCGQSGAGNLIVNVMTLSALL